MGSRILYRSQHLEALSYINPLLCSTILDVLGTFLSTSLATTLARLARTVSIVSTTRADRSQDGSRRRRASRLVVLVAVGTRGTVARVGRASAGALVAASAVEGRGRWGEKEKWQYDGQQ